MSKSRRRVQLPALGPGEAIAFTSRIDQVAKSYCGQLDELESALGMLCLGRLFGWKVLVLVHNKRTIRKYEQILGIDIRKEFQETGPLTHKSLGFELAEKAGQFWKAVSGDFSIPERRELVE